MRVFLANLWNNESGITSVEYALLLSFVASGLMVAAGLLSGAVVNQIEGAADCINGNDATTCIL
jgi:Flp pilus assembly pilin Flp